MATLLRGRCQDASGTQGTLQRGLWGTGRHPITARPESRHGQLAINPHCTQNAQTRDSECNGLFTIVEHLTHRSRPAQDGMCQFEGELWVAVLRLQFESGPYPYIGISRSKALRLFPVASRSRRKSGTYATYPVSVRQDQCSPEMCSTPRISQPKYVLP